MSSTVFILGAGASKAAGVPLMNDFLDKARDLWTSGKITSAKESFEKVFMGISKLQLVHSKYPLDIQNIESVFAAFEMAKILKRFGSYTTEQIEELVNAMRQVIVQTVQTTLRLRVHSPDELPHSPVPYDSFAGLVNYIRKEGVRKNDVGVITFNYDMAIDYSFFRNNIPLDYSLEENNVVGVPVLKLHGSINWARCSKCKKVVPWFVSDYIEKFPFPPYDIKTTNVTNLEIGSRLTSFFHCGVPALSEPVLVPPTWNKTEHYSELSNVWSRAAKMLYDAENIFIIGYSLPESDLFFKYLYALGTVGENIIRRFWVFNPDHAIENRFKKLLGPGARQRFRYISDNFDGSFHQIHNVYQYRV